MGMLTRSLYEQFRCSPTPTVVWVRRLSALLFLLVLILALTAAHVLAIPS